MEIQLFEDDEFPVWVDLDTGEITCVGFCMQCPLDPLKADCKNTLPTLAKVKSILMEYDILPLCNIYRYYFGREDFIGGVVESLKESLDSLEEGKETEHFAGRIKNAIKDISKLYCEGLDCARCLNPRCPLIDAERSEQSLKDLDEEDNNNDR